MSKMTESPSAWTMLEADEEVGHLLQENHRLALGIRAIPYKDGVALLGGHTPEMYSGYGLRKVLSQVLPLLDGQHSMQEIDQSCPDLEPRQIRNMVGNLFMNGLLRCGPASALASEMAQYLDRMVGTTGVHRSGEQAAAVLRRSRLGIFAPPQVAIRLAQLFADMDGGGTVVITQAEQLMPELDLLLVIAVPGGIDPTAVFARANKLGISALNLEINAGGARMGPLVVAQVSASYGCYLAAHTRLIDTEDEASPHAIRFWSAAAMHMSMSILTQTLRRPPVNAYIDHRWQAGRQIERRTSIARLHGWQPGGASVALAVVPGQPGYEGWKQYCSIALHTADWNPANSYLIHFKPENIQSIFERVPAIFSDIQVMLPTKMTSPNAASGLTAPVSLATLGVLATHTAGFQQRDGIPHRLVPTGGGLGSTLLLLMVRNVDGVAPGCYWFDAYAGHLERMKDIDLSSLYAWLGVDATTPAVMLSFANAAKVARKYGPFSFNISWYDAGVLLAYARNLAPALGLKLADLPRPQASELMIRLGLPASALIPTGILALHADAAPQPVAGSLDELLVRASQRRATRSWSAQVTQAQLDRFSELADRALARHERVAGLPLKISLLLLLKRAEGEDGFYEYRQDLGLRPIAPYARAFHGDILSQRRLTDAPIIVLPQIDLGPALTAVGDEAIESAYRAAGAVVGDLWLNAALADLVGTACGGAFEGRIRTVTGRHGLECFAPLALCLGSAATARTPVMSA